MAQQSYKYIYFYTTFRCYKILALFLDQHLRSALDHIRQQGSDLVFGLYHSAALRMLAVEVDGVERALGGAEAAAYAAVLVHYGSTAAQAPCRLLAHLLFGEGAVVFAESVPALNRFRLLTG